MPANLDMTKAEFISAATEAARASSARSGLPPGITVAQAALESRWGQSRLSCDFNNYFGIKAHEGVESVGMPTVEVMNGTAVKTLAKFARYDSMAACFADRDRIILRVACYAGARAHAADPVEFTRALARHWATDPDYAEKVLAIYRTNGLATLDRSGAEGVGTDLRNSDGSS